METIGKTLIIFGFLLVGVGLLLTFANKIPFLGKLPGDIYVKKENFTFYFPLATSLLLSIVVSIVLYFWGRR